MANKEQKTETLIVDTFYGILSKFDFGNINSGQAKFFSNYNCDENTHLKTLYFQEPAVQIDPAGSVITDLIVAGKERVESGTSFLYAIGHTGRLYKIQVNDPTTYNPNYDNPVVLTTLSINSPTFTRGGSIEFFGSTEQIFIGHDKGVTRINFDGTGEAFVGVLGSWDQNVPRPVVSFLGSLFYGNGDNIAQVDSTITVTSYSKLSPSFPSNTQVRDIDISPDGNYLQFVVSRLAMEDITATAQDVSTLSSSDSFVFKWNGIDTSYTSYNRYPSFSINANCTFGDSQYVFGYDVTGCSIYDPTKKLWSVPLSMSPMPNAISSNGSQIGWATVDSGNGVQYMSLYLGGKFDWEVPWGFWRLLRFGATAPETDVIRVPFGLMVSNLLIGGLVNGYSYGIASVSKFYYSTMEISSAPSVKYRFYRASPIATGLGQAAVPAVYETQNQMFGKKVRFGEIRLYTTPLVAGNSIQIDLIGSNGQPIDGGTKVFTAGSTNTIGDDFLWYNANCKPSYTVGVRITNLGPANIQIRKIEIDYESGGK